MSKSQPVVRECKVCGVPACHVYYGIIACESCKMFFKRNAENEKKILKCHFNGECNVNIYNRHVCGACRLKKCLEVGMCVERIRRSTVINRKKKPKSLELVQETSGTVIHPQKLITLDLLERDRSSLIPDQWMLMSNLIHCYDEKNAIMTAKSLGKYIDCLPPKLRFKIDSAKVFEITTLFYNLAESFIQSNHHFISLSSHDRSIVLHGAIDNITCLGGTLILRESKLIENAAYRNAMEMTYGTIPYQATLSLIPSLDQDVTLVKLALSIFAFCTCNCSVFTENASFSHFRDIKSFLRIQDMYAEVVWRYLLYRYTFKESVGRFTHLVTSIIAAVTVRVHLQTVKNHTYFVETLIENIEQGQMAIIDN